MTQLTLTGTSMILIDKLNKDIPGIDWHGLTYTTLYEMVKHIRFGYMSERTVDAIRDYLKAYELKKPI